MAIKVVATVSFREHSVTHAYYTPDTIRSVTREHLLAQPMDYFQQYPCMLGSDVRELEQHLARLVNNPQRTVDILEWGLGGSTVYFPNYLRTLSNNWSWLTIEHDQAWYDAMVPSLGSQVAVWLYAKPGDPRECHCDMTDYVEAPLRATPARKFDLIIVDGRYRRRCLLTAARSLKPQGICLLHDAARDYYHSAFKGFKHQAMVPGTQWWRGQQER